MRDHQMFSRIRNAVRSVETGTPFARGRFEGRDNANISNESHGDFTRRWQMSEQSLIHRSESSFEREPFGEFEEIEELIEAENDSPFRLSCRRMSRLELRRWEFMSGFRRPRNRSARRDAVRLIRRLPENEQALAGEALWRDGENRRARRNARACRRTQVAMVLEFPARTIHTADESAAA